ncbi:MAG TPA: hemin uptake protein HemP [Rubrivivax sp.]|nr:hemin uptake protein HemP [Rubrivivax sp.]
MAPHPSRTPVALPADAAATPQQRSAVRAVRSETLLGGAPELHIEHRGALYRLRLTSLGKLILTK